MYSFVLLSAGKGVRFGRNTPKQYLLLAGKPMIVHTIERVEKINEINEIIIVCEREYIPLIKSYIKNYCITKKVVFVEGGKTRQQSVSNALVEVSNENLILHEAARPLVSISDFNNLISCEHKNVTYSYQIPYTVLKKNADNYVSGILDRSELINIQLPQKFCKQDLVKSHEMAIKENRFFTEDASIVFNYLDTPIFCIQGMSYNIKMTEYEDLLYGEMLIKEEIFKEAD